MVCDYKGQILWRGVRGMYFFFLDNLWVYDIILWLKKICCNGCFVFLVVYIMLFILLLVYFFVVYF